MGKNQASVFYPVRPLHPGPQKRAGEEYGAMRSRGALQGPQAPLPKPP